MTGTDAIPPLPEENPTPDNSMPGEQGASGATHDAQFFPAESQEQDSADYTPKGVAEPTSVSEEAKDTKGVQNVHEPSHSSVETGSGELAVEQIPVLAAPEPPVLPSAVQPPVVPILPPVYNATVPPRPAPIVEQGPAAPPPRPFGFIPTPPNYTGPTGSQYEKKPRSFLMEAIVLTVLLCQPLGIVAIINASNVNSRYYNGDYYGARLASEAARRWIIWGLVLAVAVGLAVVGLEFLLSFGLFSED